jgi:hypothetical protein
MLFIKTAGPQCDNKYIHNHAKKKKKSGHKSQSKQPQVHRPTWTIDEYRLPITYPCVFFFFFFFFFLYIKKK